MNQKNRKNLKIVWFEMLDVLWNKYTRDTFELLDKSEFTLQVCRIWYLFDSCMIPFIRGVRIRIRGGSTLILVRWIRIPIQKGKMKHKNLKNVKIRWFEMLDVLWNKYTATHSSSWTRVNPRFRQCCGTVTIFYGSGSDFEKLWFRFRFWLLKKLWFRFRFLLLKSSGSSSIFLP